MGLFREEFIQEQRETTVGVEASRVKSLKRIHTRQVGLRVYSGSHISVAGGLGYPDMDRLWKTAKLGLESGIEYPLEPQGENSEVLVTSGSIPEDSALLEESEIILSRLRHRFPEIVINGSFTCLEYTAGLTNEKGLSLSFTSPVYKSGFSFKHKNSSLSCEGYTGTYGVDYSREKVLNDLIFAVEPFSKTTGLSNPGRMPVVLSPGTEISLIRTLLGNLTCASLERGSSWFTGKMNSTVLSPEFTVIQTCDSSNTGLKFFDKEGTVNHGHSLTLIKKGRPLRPLTDRLSAGRYGCENSGSAFSGRYDAVPAVGMPFVRLGSSGKSLNELLQGREALFLVVPGGGTVSPNGRFSSTVQLGYLVRDGKITGRIPPAGITASLYDMFGAGYIGCSSDSMLQMTHAPAVVCEMEVNPLTD